MANYYFTFGQAHHQIDGTPMKDYFIKVIADDYESARTRFLQWTTEFMEAPEKWAFQYSEKDFNAEYFPKGEYLTL